MSDDATREERACRLGTEGLRLSSRLTEEMLWVERDRARERRRHRYLVALMLAVWIVGVVALVLSVGLRTPEPVPSLPPTPATGQERLVGVCEPPAEDHWPEGTVFCRMVETD